MNKIDNSDGKKNAPIGSFFIESEKMDVLCSFAYDRSNISAQPPERKKINVMIVKIHGTIDLLSSTEFQKYTMDFVLRGEKYMLLDLTKLDFIDSMGLSTILMLYQKIYDMDGKIAILNPRPSIMVVLKITKVNQRIPVFNSAEEAHIYFSNYSEKK